MLFVCLDGRYPTSCARRLLCNAEAYVSSTHMPILRIQNSEASDFARCALSMVRLDGLLAQNWKDFEES